MQLCFPDKIFYLKNIRKLSEFMFCRRNVKGVHISGKKKISTISKYPLEKASKNDG